MTYYIMTSKGSKLGTSKASFELDKMAGEYLSEIEVAGFSKEDLDITVKKESCGDVVTINAVNSKRKAEISLLIPAAADASLLRASSEYGLLTLSAPVKGGYQPKRIKVT
jgi:HSP20 family molecular chaperone IbpA